MNEINIQDENFFINSSLIFSADSKIIDYLIDNEKIYVLVDWINFNSDRNIFCYSVHGNLLWQIEKMNPLTSRSYYTAIYLSSEDLMGYHVNGIEVTIDKGTGKILGKELIK